jgi:cysteinyl-tRNA synthetase
MSKSLGNFVTINELLETDTFGGHRWPGAVLRYAMLMTHYRQPIDWTVTRLEEAALDLDAFRAFSFDQDDTGCSPEIIDAISDDLNTPRVIAELRRLLAESKRSSIQISGVRPGAVLKASCRFLGLDIERVDLQAMMRAAISVDVSKVEALRDARLAARKAKNWAESDRIRDELADMGIQLKDGKDPQTGEPITTWEVKR